MAVLLNELFFPKADSHTQAIYSALAFCSTYILRPFWVIIFGWLGDKIGRKIVIIITTFIMSATCIIIANLPTYAQIGITATYIITICRAMQGLSSTIELIGTHLYLTEAIKPPARYPIVALTSVFFTLGGTFALLIAFFATSYSINWRAAFWFGSMVAVIGVVARTILQETRELLIAKKEKVENIVSQKNKTNDSKNAFALFCIGCVVPVCFYFVYVYCGNVLKHDFGFSSKQVIQQNFFVSIIQLIGVIIVAFLSYKIHPLKIVKTKLVLFIITVILAPFLITQIHSHYTIFFIQCCIMLFPCNFVPALPITYKYISVLRRFTYVSFAYAASRVIMYVVTSFGLVYLVELFGYIGLLFIMIPVIIGYIFALVHFDRLEKKTN